MNQEALEKLEISKLPEIMKIRTTIPEWAVIGCLEEDGGVVVHTEKPRFQATYYSGERDGGYHGPGVVYVAWRFQTFQNVIWTDPKPDEETCLRLMDHAARAVMDNLDNRKERPYEAIAAMVLKGVIAHEAKGKRIKHRT